MEHEAIDSASPAKAETLRRLRARIARAQTAPRAVLAPAGLSVRTGDTEGPRLALGRVHEVLPDRPGHGAATGFVARCLAAAQAADTRPVMWVATARERGEEGRLYAPGLAQAGLDPARLILVTPRTAREVLWVLEEALGSGALAGVAAWVGELKLTPSRRLALAAERHGTPLFLLRPWQAEGATAAETRWRLAPLPSAPDPFDPQAPGAAVWRVERTKARGAAPRTWEVACDDAEDAIDLAAHARGGTLAAGAAPIGLAAAG